MNEAPLAKEPLHPLMIVQRADERGKNIKLIAKVYRKFKIVDQVIPYTDNFPNEWLKKVQSCQKLAGVQAPLDILASTAQAESADEREHGKKMHSCRSELK